MTERPRLPVLRRFLVFFLVLLTGLADAQTRRKPQPEAGGSGLVEACGACIRSEMDFLASDALRGRGSGTSDEFVAATYVASLLERYGVQPAGDAGTYIQRASVIRQLITAPPQLHFMTPGDGIPAQQVLWTHGKEMLVLDLAEPNFKGPLKRVNTDRHDSSLQGAAFHETFQQAEADVGGAGNIVLILGNDHRKVRATARAALRSGALAVLLPATPNELKDWNERGKELPTLPLKLEGSAEAGLGRHNQNVFALNEQALAQMNGIPDGTTLYLESTTTVPEKSFTWNALGELRGADPALRKAAILLSAHIDHLGTGPAVNGDSIYNGADDDASGTVAVLELARVLASGRKPRHTVLFAFFGSEEDGGLGSGWFLQHPPVPLDEIATNLEFEMIGRRDPKYPGDSLWLSGWERSNLGPALAAHGAKVVPDARPEEHFFMRSDNYVLAKRGVVAQTFSSFGLHADYHQPSDDLSGIDFKHMTAAIQSLLAPVKWLVNSSFKPEWKPGGKP